MAGNVWEWTDGALGGGQLPGVIGEPIEWRDWNDPQMNWNGLPSSSRPTALVAAYGLSQVTNWTLSNGIGGIFSYHADTLARGFLRSGSWDNYPNGGVLVLHLGNRPADTNELIGFRVVR